MSDEWFMARMTVLKTSPGGWTAKAVVIRREEVASEPSPFAMDDEDEGATPKSITLKKTAVFEHTDRDVARSNAMNWLMENT